MLPEKIVDTPVEVVRLQLEGRGELGIGEMGRVVGEGSTHFVFRSS